MSVRYSRKFTARTLRKRRKLKELRTMLEAWQLPVQRGGDERDKPIRKVAGEYRVYVLLSDEAANWVDAWISGAMDG